MIPIKLDEELLAEIVEKRKIKRIKDKTKEINVNNPSQIATKGRKCKNKRKKPLVETLSVPHRSRSSRQRSKSHRKKTSQKPKSKKGKSAPPKNRSARSNSRSKRRQKLKRKYGTQAQERSKEINSLNAKNKNKIFLRLIFWEFSSIKDVKMGVSILIRSAVEHNKIVLRNTFLNFIVEGCRNKLTGEINSDTFRT